MHQIAYWELGGSLLGAHSRPNHNFSSFQTFGCGALVTSVLD
ncbi:hypothetical protein LEP1GSC202_0447 [Leptospira yanagawae serovar Saopaulo str. Sao Paulo = ATCC 700523]|uniref:Uncharacterized protein n=1 Tax=Leptospira yanagawae serovar Saopaulo str. Sao Paulo = ATCC 700523 TaxID=1249483 RepID=A0A5E8HH50_9LEPT|nr:hypothetical protein LEP1GSC202_0447 [Leptospira yanagawae serovar Saopaulo str. Sao Paulo = ATCC 700523]